MAMSFAIREAIWLDKLFKDDFGISSPDCKDSIVFFADNQGALKMAQNDSVNERSKHIDVKYHFIKHHVQSGNVKFEYFPTD